MSEPVAQCTTGWIWGGLGGLDDLDGLDGWCLFLNPLRAAFLIPLHAAGQLRREANFVREVGGCQVRRRRWVNWDHRQSGDLHHRALKCIRAVFGKGFEQCKRRCQRNHGRSIVGSGRGALECPAVRRVGSRLIELLNAACNGFGISCSTNDLPDNRIYLITRATSTLALVKL